MTAAQGWSFTTAQRGSPCSDMEVYYILLIFILGEEKEMDYVAAEIRLSAFECMQKARDLNADGNKYVGACMPIIND